MMMVASKLDPRLRSRSFQHSKQQYASQIRHGKRQRDGETPHKWKPNMKQRRLVPVQFVTFDRSDSIRSTTAVSFDEALKNCDRDLTTGLEIVLKN